MKIVNRWLKSIFMMKKNMETAILAAIEAGEEIMRIYGSNAIQVETKLDHSPLTVADKSANGIINKHLAITNIPIISEENKQIKYEIRKNWQECWIVDPLDGTKEFISRNGEFTVNIALIRNNCPLLGIIYVPVTKELYFADVENSETYKCFISSSKNFKEELKNSTLISPQNIEDKIRVVGSRSHMDEETMEYISSLKMRTEKKIEIVQRGSSLKFCLVAEGLADVYPRFAPTMEWDTAAGQAICMASGLKIYIRQTKEMMLYNKEELINPSFLVSNFE